MNIHNVDEAKSQQSLSENAPPKVYILDTTLFSKGKKYEVQYWPGSKRWGSELVTSFKQYLDKLFKNLSKSKLALHTISSKGESVPIENDEDLRNAVAHLPHRGRLVVIAIDQEGLTGPYKEPIAEIIEQFGVPSFTKCYQCNMKTLIGLRYFWHDDYSYTICPQCYNQLPADRKSNWVTGNSGGAPWDSDAPKAPLYMIYPSKYRENVKHLQYILTRLGYMPLSGTKGSEMGKYEYNTEVAVKEFKEKFEIKEGPLKIYTFETEKKLIQVVRLFRSEGHKHI